MARKLICKSPIDAQILRDKVAKHRPGRRFDVYPITRQTDGRCLGYQVVEVKRVGLWGWAPTTPSLEDAAGHRSGACGAACGLGDDGVLVDKDAGLHWRGGGRQDALFGRATLVSLVTGGGQATLTLARKVIEKRGLAGLLEVA